MKQLNKKLEQIIYGYDPQEFFPVRYDGQLINKREYVSYKLYMYVGKPLLRLCNRFDSLTAKYS